MAAHDMWHRAGLWMGAHDIGHRAGLWMEAGTTSGTGLLSPSGGPGSDAGG
jgi:hypothetical protein